MISDASLAQTSSRSIISRPLKRGRACMNCRFLKIKCDGMKPICGPCRKHPKDDECEYSDGPARSRTKALEDTVQRLEARLHELEHPEESTPSVMLYDPYAPYPPPPPPQVQRPQLAIPQGFGTQSLPGTPYSALPRLLTPGGSLSSSSPESQGLTPLSPFSPPSTTATSTHGHSPLGIFNSQIGANRPDSSMGSNLEFDPHLCDALIRTFLPHGSTFGLFLNPARFLPPSSPGTPPTPVSTRTSQALLYALCTWGAHLSSPPSPTPSPGHRREDRFLARALQCMSSDLSSNPQILLQTLQAEVLVATYFWRTGALLKARVHAGIAASIVLGAGLNRVGAAQPSEPPILEFGFGDTAIPSSAYHEHSPYAGDVRLPSAADPLDEAERILGFWAVFTLQRALAVALAPPGSSDVSGTLDVGRVDVPWPREMDEYTHRYGGAEARGEATIVRYLAGSTSASPTYGQGQYEHGDGGDAVAAMLVKAHILLHRAVHLQGQWAIGSSSREQQAITQAFHSLGNLIDSLRAQLPSRHQSPSPTYSQSSLSSHSQASSTYPQSHHSSPYSHANSLSPSPHSPEQQQPDGRVRLAHALLDGTMIKLNEVFMYTDAGARGSCVRAAMDMLRDAQMSGQEQPHPIMGTLWTSAVRIVGEEIKQLRSRAHAQPQPPTQAWSQDDYDYGYEKELSACLNDGLAALQAAAGVSAMMRHQLTLARDLLAGAGV